MLVREPLMKYTVKSSGVGFRDDDLLCEHAEALRYNYRLRLSPR